MYLNTRNICNKKVSLVTGVKNFLLFLNNDDFLQKKILKFYLLPLNFIQDTLMMMRCVFFTLNKLLRGTVMQNM